MSREIGWHGGGARYRASRVERAAKMCRRKLKIRKLDDDPCLLLVAVELLKQGWSPQQIAGRLPIDHPGEEAVRVSHETVYRWIYALRSGRTRRKPAHGRTPEAPRIARMRWIEERPADAVDRQAPGHWEGDLIIGNDGKSAVGTLVERVSRFVVLVPLARP
ncbi:hypothetical protein GCM10009550_42200 [Actinocorallia libanotica]|uniref:Homeodomain-containing protein n=1 Tax=Actinocorallia libanotica TaxID=46162 RepID=A0ABP4BZF7_9ACTN